MWKKKPSSDAMASRFGMSFLLKCMAAFFWGGGDPKAFGLLFLHCTVPQPRKFGANKKFKSLFSAFCCRGLSVGRFPTTFPGFSTYPLIYFPGGDASPEIPKGTADGHPIRKSGEIEKPG